MVSVGPMLIRIRKHFHTGGPLRHRWIKAVSTLFDGREVECRGVGDRLKELRMGSDQYRFWEWPYAAHYAKSEPPAERREVGIKIRVMCRGCGNESTNWYQE